MDTYLDDLCATKCLASLRRVLAAVARVQLLPLLLQVVHGFLLLLSSRSSVETDEVSRRVKLEALRAELRINADEDHRYEEST